MSNTEGEIRQPPAAIAGESARTPAPTGGGSDPYAARPWLAEYDAAIPPEVEIPPLTVDGLLRAAAARHPSRPALSFFGARTTYAELDAQVDAFARAIRRLGLEKGDRISLHLPTSPAFVIAFLGGLRAGCVVVPMNPLYVERELEAVLREAAPRLSVGLDLVVPRLLAVRERLGDVLGPAPGGVQAISTGIVDSLPRPLRWLYPFRARREGRWHPVPHRPRTPNLFRLLAAAGTGIAEARRAVPRGRPGGQPVAAAAEPDDLALLQPTGGTTGIPKLAMLSHRNLVANAIQCSMTSAEGGERGEDVLCALPYFHIYGLTVAMLFALHRGGTQILQPRWDPTAALEAIEKERPRFFPGAPIMYATLAGHPDLARHDVRSIEVCISGSAPLPPAVQERFEAASGGRVVEGYGLTEASPVTHTNSCARERRPGTVGLPLPSTEARIVDLATGLPVPTGQVGELCVRGPQVMSGYWRSPAETAAVLRDGWLYTGDLATMDEDGFFRIVDRRKDLVINGGLNVYPREVEEVLLRHPAVADAVVVGQPDPIRGELPIAFVVLRPGAAPTAETIVGLDAHCRANLARYKVPCAFEFRPELPHSTVGKVLRRELAEEVRAAAESTSGGAARH